MNYTLEKCEQETVINFDRESDRASLYTSDSIWMRKLDKLVEEHPENFEVKNVEKLQGKVVAKTYLFPKKFVTIRSKDRTPNYTEEQRQTASERMKVFNDTRIK